MRYNLLQKIEATDPLARLFNDYLKGLSTLAIMSEPSYVTMAELRALFLRTGKARDRNYLRHSARRYFELTVLRNSLHDIHRHVLETIALLEGFFTDYNGDLQRYAIENRLALIKEYGSDDERDWYRDNEADEAEAWKVTYKDDPESLSHYTLHADLGLHFGSDSRGEHLGTSGPADFYPYTTMVEQQSEFSFRKLLSSFTKQEVTLTRAAEDGSQLPMTLADHLENEMNEDIRSNELVLRFNTALAMCVEIAKHFPQLPLDQPAPYQALLDCLRAVRDVETEPGEMLHYA